MHKGQTRRVWTREEIVDAIKTFHAETGTWPVFPDFCRANGLPYIDTVERCIGTLAEARRQAGMPGGGCEWVGSWEAHGPRRQAPE